MQKGTKWMLVLIALLVLANIALVATIWLKKENTTQPPPGDARDYLIKTLSLTDSQVKSFDSLRKGHFERINQSKKELRRLKDGLFSILQEKDTNIKREQLATYISQKIGEMQADIDKETFNHFAQLRDLLTKDQVEKFDNTIQDVLRTMGREGRPDGPLPPHREGMPVGPPPGEGPPR